MITFTVPTWSYVTPTDGNLGTVIAEFCSLVPDNSSLRSIIYGLTDPVVLEGHVLAQNRGVDDRAILDRSQSIDGPEAALLNDFWNRFKRWDNQNNPLWIIADSPIAGQIVHGKMCWANWTDKSSKPDSLPIYGTWQEYVKAGYPTVLRGSYNWTSTASKQVNTLEISPSWELAQQYQQTFDTVWQFNMAHHADWNTKV